MDLFDLRIRDNLCLGKDISDDKILELLEEAGLIGWYKELCNKHYLFDNHMMKEVITV